MKVAPPRWLSRLLTRLLDPRIAEASLGDLHEKFERRVAGGMWPWKAKVVYVFEALGFIKLTNLKRQRSHAQSSHVGYAVFFFLRLVQRDKGYYFVSLFGLTISLTSFLLIMMFVYNELSYDRFHENASRIYRVSTRLLLNDVEYDMATSQFPLAGVIAQEIPAVEKVTRIHRTAQLLTYGENTFEELVVYADDSFHEIFSFPFLYGSRETATAHAAGIVLSEETAVKYFGDTNPLGKTVTANGVTLEVTGVLARIPDQSHLRFDALIPLRQQLQAWKAQTGLEGRENKWFWVGAYTYVLLHDKAQVDQLEAGLNKIIATHFPERYKSGGEYIVQNVRDIHLRSNRDAEMAQGGSILYVSLFGIVAVVIMVISSINLVNLSWFKVSNRVREVGIRKFLGQNASLIITQFSIESILIALTAFVLSLALCITFIAPFNNLVQKNIVWWSPANLCIILGGLLMTLLVSLLSVTRPALRYATAVSGTLLLRNHSSAHRANRLRNVMIGIQVGFSFVLLVFSLLIGRQIDFFRDKGLGFDKENILVVTLNDDVVSHFDAFRDELQRSTLVRSVSGVESPGKAVPGWRFVPEGGSYEKPVMLPFTTTHDGFIETLGIQLVAGTDFPKSGNADTIPGFMINKQAAIELGWPDDPIGRTMEVFAPGTTDIMMKGRVIGMMDNYHYESLHNPVRPLVICLGPFFSEALIKFNAPIDERSVAMVQAALKKLTDRPMECEVLEDKLDRLYTNESQLSQVILFFTFIALYLTCYGLFAMSSLVFSSRLKEVAIRKVFGANQMDIVRQFYTRYALFNLLAIIIGLPVAIYIGDQWLTSFPYHVPLDSTLFIKAGFVILLAGMISVSYYLTRVAKSNPVKFLRGE